MMIRQLGWSDELIQTRIKSAWHQLAGPLIASHTKKLYVHKRVLYIKVDSAALRQELSMGSAQILARLNAHLGEDYLTEVVIR